MIGGKGCDSSRRNATTWTEIITPISRGGFANFITTPTLRIQPK